MIRRVLVVAALSIASFAFAQEDAGTAAPTFTGPPPTAEAIKNYLEYQEKGASAGPVLLDLIPCIKVDTAQGSPTRFQCVEPVAGPVPSGTVVLGWLQWMCPKDGNYPDVEIQTLFNNVVQSTVSSPVTGFGRTRAWKGLNVKFTKVGKWTIKVIRGDKEYGSTTVDVVAK